ncbi:MAG TPA: hypothetical protein VD999_01280 [Vitreimonas sp.]|nr:hypothetical protein [Vitreimonas sp.]
MSRKGILFGLILLAAVFAPLWFKMVVAGKGLIGVLGVTFFGLIALGGGAVGIIITFVMYWLIAKKSEQAIREYEAKQKLKKP